MTRGGDYNGFESIEGEVGTNGSHVENNSRANSERPPEVKRAKVLSVDDLAENPLNPRDDLGDLEDLKSIADDQVQPIVVVRRTAFLNVYKKENIDKPYVVICGNRRLAAARKFGRPNLDVFVRDDWATSHGDLLKRIMAENTDRAGFDVIEEAKVVEQLVAEFGSQQAVAVEMGKVKGWVSQRLALLRLPTELQGALRTGDLSVKAARSWGNLPEEQQLKLWSQYQKDKLRQQARERKQVEDHERERGSSTDESTHSAPTSGGPQPAMRAVTKALRQATPKDANTAAQVLFDFLGESKSKQLIRDMRKLVR